MTSDTEVIEAVKGGDRERYAELVERYQKMVYGIAWSRLGDAGLCEDAAQETFVKAFRYLVALRDPAKFPRWLARIARNVSNSLLRTRKRELDKRQRWQIEARAEPAAPIPMDDEPSIGQTLAQTLAGLPEQHRECLVLFYIEGKNVREAAGLLGISETALKTRLHRARKVLRGRLEEELESSLSGLGPRTGFSAAVMPLLPTTPWAAAGIGGASTTAKASGLFGKSFLPLSGFFFMPLFQGAFVAAMFGWFGKLEAANLAASPNRRFRKKVIGSNVGAFIIAAVLAGLAAFTLPPLLGPSWFFGLLALFCLWAAYSAARALRVNRSPYTIGTVLTGVAFLSASVLIGFFHAPFWTFFATLFPLNIVLYHTNKTKPVRHDYNLFLRQAGGLLGTPSPLTGERTRLTQIQMRGFARFLGARFLVRDYRLREEGMVLYLPPVKPGLGQFLSYTNANSTMSIDFNGRVEADLGRKDLRSLQAMMEGVALQQDFLEGNVAKVLDSALELFLAGRQAEAEALLQTEADNQVFQKSTAKSNEHRVRGLLAIVVSFLMLLSFGPWSGEWGIWNHRRPRPVSQAMARETIATWCRLYPWSRGDLVHLMNGKKHPPIESIGAENRAAYKRIVAQLLTEADGGDLPTRVFNNLRKPKRLYHVIENRLLTRDELAKLGLSSKRVRAALNDGGSEKLKQIAQGSTITEVCGTGTYTMPDIDENACRLACLKAFGCLDFVDGDAIAEEIAAKQITPDWQTPAGYEAVDTGQAAGLFHFGFCDLRATRGALWSLQTLGKLDLVDKEACLEAILRLYQGRGRFKAKHRNDGIHLYGNEDDAFYAMESLAILRGWGRIRDPWRWEFAPKTSSREQDGPVRGALVTSEALISWAYQLRLEQLRATPRQLIPPATALQTPPRSQSRPQPALHADEAKPKKEQPLRLPNREIPGTEDCASTVSRATRS